jgi:methyl-accepting chemotaxis protein
MKPFRDLPIKQKLTALILVITTAAMLLCGFGMVFADSILFHGYLKRDLAMFARVIADNSTASLAFDDPGSAGEILGALRARPHLAAACLFRTDGTPFAEYLRDGNRYPCTLASEGDDIRSTLETLTVTRQVMLGIRRIGTLTIVYDLGEIIERIQVYSMTVLLVLVISSLLVVLFSSRLRTMFVSPILELAGATARVSKTRDYSLRAEKLTNDEVGALATAFNEMLAGIESRDTDLRKTLAEREQAGRSETGGAAGQGI